jgi:RNA polymerase sigma-70 factor (ECF subfamily)
VAWAEADFREARTRVVAALAARLRDLDLAEEAFAEACASAVEAWRKKPADDAAAWLYRTALRKAFDAMRRARTRQAAAFDAPEPDPTPEDLVMRSDDPIPDERLRLIFVCCHPAIAPDARAALTLKVVCGLSTERLARAFLTAEPAMLQRITRAKAKIRDAGVPFEVPSREHWPERLEAVLATLEIAYAQAYEDAAGAGETAGFAAEVLRLSGLLAELLPGEPEVLALAALARFAEARRPARLDDSGAMTPLSEQDPSQWRGELIDEGARLLDRAAELKRTGPYQLMAAIHLAHLSRRETGVTPWPGIVTLYDALLQLRPTAVVAVNRAVALCEARGPAAGLEALDAVPLDRRLADWLPYQAAKAELNRRAGRPIEARAALARALELSPPPAERLFLERRLAELESPLP